VKHGRAALFPIPEMPQYPANDVMVLNASDDSGRTTAANVKFGGRRCGQYRTFSKASLRDGTCFLICGCMTLF